MTKKTVSTKTKTTVVGTAAGAAVSYAAYLAQQKYGIPVEVTVSVAGAITGFLARWAGKLMP